MPRWKPEEVWKNQDVFVIGGGPSLKGFDWNFLRPEMTIGCNYAFTLGQEICKICIFGDERWWKRFQSELVQYKGVIFTNVTSFQNKKISWVWTLTRESRGLHTNALGWNSNTGASAINLALILGAKRVYLLGFDMCKSSSGESNYHNKIIDPKAVRDSAYQGFLDEFRFVVRDWKKKFADREIINVTNNSRLEGFPRICVDEFWTKRKAERCVLQPCS